MALKAGYVGIKRNKLNSLGSGGIKYSTDETLTGDTWYDGKPVYCRVLKFDTPRTLPQNGEITFEPASYIETLLDVVFFRTAAEGIDPWYVRPGGVGVKSSTGKLDVRNTVSLSNYDTVLIYYTKRTV